MNFLLSLKPFIIAILFENSRDLSIWFVNVFCMFPFKVHFHFLSSQQSYEHISWSIRCLDFLNFLKCMSLFFIISVLTPSNHYLQLPFLWGGYGCSNMHLRFLQSLFERVDDKLRQQLYVCLQVRKCFFKIFNFQWEMNCSFKNELIFHCNL